MHACVHAGPALSSQSTPINNHPSLVTADGKCHYCLGPGILPSAVQCLPAGSPFSFVVHVCMQRTRTVPVHACISSRHLLHATTSPTNAPFVGMYVHSPLFWISHAFNATSQTKLLQWRTEPRKQVGRACSKQPQSILPLSLTLLPGFF
ncbi:hypothetical protein SORBI_3003G250160 [Sorghum bicolor]|uniref:Uncharacterized protein n=1 Tax=Sorghum bicolor TaxID=4558 RepID=A0A1W0VYV2_SORBI|nr:hypothetical protein SORBI_3003G250160 [Sorghum bicolor]